MRWHAIVLPLSAGFKQLRDRLMYDGETALIFETREDAQRYVDRHFHDTTEHEIVPVSIEEQKP